jgi:hypothetical protein
MDIKIKGIYADGFLLNNLKGIYYSLHMTQRVLSETDVAFRWLRLALD